MKQNRWITSIECGQKFSFGVIIVVFVAALVSIATAQSPSVKQTRPIVIRSEPNATVFIDGVRFGQTDESGNLKIRTLSAGRHVLRVRADGFKETEKPLILPQSDVNVALVKTSDPAEMAFQDAERLVPRDRDKAAEAYRKAIKLRPNYIAAYIG